MKFRGYSRTPEYVHGTSRRVSEDFYLYIMYRAMGTQTRVRWGERGVRELGRAPGPYDVIPPPQIPLAIGSPSAQPS